MIFINHLELIRQFMGANLLSLEQVDSITALTHMKVPYAEYLSSQAMNWLISFDNKHFIVEVTY